MSGISKKWLWWMPVGILLCWLVGMQVCANLVLWPLTDEANYLLEARKMSLGMLPYRDFFEFVTPLGQAIGALFFKLNGFSVIGIRLFVLFGWVVELLLIYEMAKNHLSRPWLILMLAFIWLADARYIVYQHHFWSGLTALVAVFFVWKHLQLVYAGNPRKDFLLWAAVFTAATGWITQSLGVMMVMAIGLFSCLHCFLHEREERGVSYTGVSNQAVFRRWLSRWGLYWLLPVLLCYAAGAGILMALGIWPDFLRDAVGWLAGGNYKKTTVIGYFPTFHKEFIETVKPLIDGVAMPHLLVYLFRIPIAVHLFLIGALPVLGILGMGYQVPSRFVYRLLQRPDEELLLFWVGGTAMILSTLSYSTSMHIVSNGALGFLLGFLVLGRWFQNRPKADQELRVLTTIFCVLLVTGYAIGGGIQWLFGMWMPPFPALPERLLYTDFSTTAQNFLTVHEFLEKAQKQNRSVFVFSETPGLYLPNLYQQAARFTLIIPIYTPPPQMREIMADLEKNKPLYIVDDQTTRYIKEDFRFAAYPPEQLRLPELAAYLKANYWLRASQGRFLLYERSSYFD